MDKKKILAILLFLLMGFFMFTFANPKVELEKQKTPTEKVEKEDETTEDNSSNANTGNNVNRPNRGNNVVILPPVVTPIVIERDLIAPVIIGVENGKVYVDQVNFTIVEENLARVIIDGKEYTTDIPSSVTGKGIHTITAYDEAGNSTSVTFTIENSIKYTVDIDKFNDYLDNGGYDGYYFELIFTNKDGEVLDSKNIKDIQIKAYTAENVEVVNIFAKDKLKNNLANGMIINNGKISEVLSGYANIDGVEVQSSSWGRVFADIEGLVTVKTVTVEALLSDGKTITNTKEVDVTRFIKFPPKCGDTEVILATLLAMEAKEYDKELSLNAFNLVFGMDDKCENKDSYQTRIINSALLNLNKNALRHAVKEYDEQSDKTGMPYELLGNLIKEANRVIDEKDYTFSIDSINNLFDLKNNLNDKRDLLKLYNENKEVLVNYTNELTKDLNLTLYNKNLVDNKLSELLNTIDGKSKKELNDSLENAKIEMKKFVDSLDITAPLLTLNGDSDIKIKRPDKYKELGINIEDQSTTSTTTSIVFIKPYETTENKVNNVDTTKIGTYVITYTVVDASENTSSITRNVIVDQLFNSELDLIIVPYMNNKLMTTTVLDRVEVNTTMPTFSAYVKDVINNKVFNATDLSDYLVIDTSNLDMTKVGTYEVKFIATDWAGNTRTVVQKVKVVDTTKPVITLDETNTTIKVVDGVNVNIPTANVTDNYDKNVTVKVEVNTEVEYDTRTGIIGYWPITGKPIYGLHTYKLTYATSVTYTAIDSEGNRAETNYKFATPLLLTEERVI